MTRKAHVAPDTLTVDSQVWRRKDLDDRSGHWFELAGPFGELIVEEARSGGFLALWWPPKIRSGDGVQIGKGYKTRRGAMKAAMAYIERLRAALAATTVVGLPT